MMDIKQLEDRIQFAKSFLRNEVTAHKVENGKALLDRSQVGYHLDTIHEIERTGLRKLTEVDFIKIQRVLTSVEACVGLSKN